MEKQLSQASLMLLKTAMPTYLDSLVTSTGKATAVNTEGEQDAVKKSAHDQILAIDRGLYLLASLLPSVQDNGRQTVVEKLLGTSFSSGILTAEQEYIGLQHIVSHLPATRRFKLFVKLAKARVNNTRTRKLILTSILSNEHLPFEAVKYRNKLRTALKHVLGERRASITKAILAKSSAPTEIRILRERQMIANFLGPDISETQLECVSFILGNSGPFKTTLLQQYEDCKVDFSKGKGLPRTTLEGIRSKYHREIPVARIFELSEEAMTDKEKMITQTTQKKVGVTKVIEFNPRAMSLNDLAIYIYEKGTTVEINQVIDEKAKKAYEQFPFKYKNIGIIFDASQSMSGHVTQPMRPMAIAYATMKTLMNAEGEVHVKRIGGKIIKTLPFPQDGTDLATGLQSLAKNDVDCVFVVSDGYENAIAGRFDELLSLLRKVGWKVPIIYLSSTMAAEAAGIRKFTENTSVLCVPVMDITKVGVSMLRSIFITDPVMGIGMLENSTLKLVGGN